jgi:hypothetical protein
MLKKDTEFDLETTLTTTGTVYVPWRHGGVDVEIAIGVLPNSPMPILLSKNVLKDMEMITDFGKNQVTTPQLREEGRYLKVRESCTGHMLMPMTKKAWNADLKDQQTEVIYVNVPGDKKDEYKITYRHGSWCSHRRTIGDGNNEIC